MTGPTVYIQCKFTHTHTHTHTHPHTHPHTPPHTPPPPPPYTLSMFGRWARSRNLSADGGHWAGWPISSWWMVDRHRFLSFTSSSQLAILDRSLLTTSIQRSVVPPGFLFLPCGRHFSTCRCGRWSGILWRWPNRCSRLTCCFHTAVNGTCDASHSRSAPWLLCAQVFEWRKQSTCGYHQCATHHWPHLHDKPSFSQQHSSSLLFLLDQHGEYLLSLSRCTRIPWDRGWPASITLPSFGQVVLIYLTFRSKSFVRYVRVLLEMCLLSLFGDSLLTFQQPCFQKTLWTRESQPHQSPFQ